jgi:hypothetical protein
MTKTLRVAVLFLITLLLALSPAASTGLSVDRASAEQLRGIQKYIKQSWHTLTRSNAQLAHAAVDPKFQRTTIGPSMSRAARISRAYARACAPR